LIGPTTTKNVKKDAPPKKDLQQKSPKKTGKQKGKKTSSLAKGGALRFNPTSHTEQEPVKEQQGMKGSATINSESLLSVPDLESEEKAALAPPAKETVDPDDVKGKEATAAQPVDTKKAKTVKKKKKASKKAQPKKASKEETGKALDTVSANGSSTEDTGNGGEQPNAVAEGDGWHTVGQVIPAAEKFQSTNGSEVPYVAQNAENDAPKPPTKSSAAETAAVAPMDPVKTSATPANQSEPEKNGKASDSMATKAKPANANSAPVPTVPEVSFTDDDAALAMKLQEEEEKLAKEFSQPAGEDSWAEVAPKKSRRKSTEPVAGPTATAAW